MQDDVARVKRVLQRAEAVRRACQAAGYDEGIAIIGQVVVQIEVALERAEEQLRQFDEVSGAWATGGNGHRRGSANALADVRPHGRSAVIFPPLKAAGR
jgi:hypothetical protein